ncbi:MULTISPECIES: glutaminase [Sphingobium]|jgi:glutaminase|uniref:Glutaminase n=1 Tax=Sphingobium yanoikuyae TaxID=13690 RepID=A0A0J9CYI5_SPHYA|nr:MULTISPECIES: glutaminase [Sphingobium]ATP20325.1 glutaminase [Sphingobium yanoikuyae]KMW30024.1 glutaminase [Sphingobium yanoikuyae]TKV40958.1 glutaminase [Sphingobium sp. MP9-4]
MDLTALIDDIVAAMARETERGTVASYIPELAKVDAGQFGVAIATADGRLLTGGDADTGFSIQSISKVFALTLALGKVGDQLWDRVGREPSGNAFNSIVQLEQEHGIPRNPFINAGAIVVADVNLGGHQPRVAIGEMLRFVRYLAGDDAIRINEEVAASETATGYRNMALANYMRAFNNVRHPVDLVLGSYFHQCAIEMSCRQLALAGRYLMLDGRHPEGGRVVSTSRARRINALMLTCGHYDASGDFAFRVGIPGKSGVGGGILAIVPGRAAIAVWSPGLNASGNSALGTKALEMLARRTGWSVFSPPEVHQG